MRLSRARDLTALLIAILWWTCPALAQETKPRPVRVTLRADWNNPTQAVWEGHVALNAGRITSVTPLELSIGQCRLQPSSDSRQVQFNTSGPVAWCGLDITVEAPTDALVELALDGHRLVTRIEELLDGSSASMKWDGSARLRREASDILRVYLNRPHLIFAPGEDVELLELEVNLLTPTAQVVPTDLQAVLRRAREPTDLVSVERRLNVATNSQGPLRRQLSLRMPDQEGIYELTIRADPAGFKPVVRHIQVVVLNLDLDSSTAKGVSEFQAKLVQQIDLAQSSSSARWSSGRWLGRTKSLLTSFWGTSEEGSEATRRPAHLYQLDVDDLSVPHAVRIEYEAQGSYRLAAAILEPGPQGGWIKLPVLSGVASEEDVQPDGMQSHRIIFWPQVSPAVISLDLESQPGTAALKGIRLEKFPQELPALNPQELEGERRILGLYLDGPAAWQSFGLSRVTGGFYRLATDDWKTFYEAARHAIDYAQFSGANCVVASVVREQGALYPSELLSPDFNMDNGYLADTARDPIRKDVVELLMRMCGRKRLGMIPSVRFSGPVETLERRIAQGDSDAEGLVLVSHDGQVWHDTDPQLRTRYNPLHPEVRRALLEVVKELVQRYKEHESFKGLMLDLAPSSHLVLPGIEWGYDEHTLHRFARDTGLELPQGGQGVSQSEAAYRLLTGPAREKWVAWRWAQMAEFYERVLAELQQVRPQAQLILAVTTLTGTGTAELREALRRGESVEELLRSRGMDLGSWDPPSGIIVLRPYLSNGQRPEEWHVNSSRDLSELFVHLRRKGSVCITRPEPVRLPLEASNDAGEVERTVPVPLIRAGDRGLKHMAQSVAADDSQVILYGGPAVPLGQEDSLRRFAQVFHSLPTGGFQAQETAHPVTVRWQHDGTDTLMYVVNSAVYQVRANLKLKCSEETTIVDGLSGESVPGQRTEEGLELQLELDPCQTLHLRAPGADAAVAQCTVQLPASAQRGMRAKFERLSQAMVVLQREAPRTLDGLPPNGDFEHEEVGNPDQPSGWQANGLAAHCVLDDQTVQAGNYSLRLSGGAGSSVSSPPFDPPTGNTLGMNVWLRPDRPGLQLRWVLHGIRNGVEVYDSSAEVTLTTNWGSYKLRASDLPDKGLDQVQLNFELLQPGSVWIDEARLCALPISSVERNAIFKKVSSALKAWTDKRIGDFQRLADGYWARYLIDSVDQTDGWLEPEELPLQGPSTM